MRASSLSFSLSLLLYRVPMRFPLLVCLIAFGNYYYAVGVVVVVDVVGLSASKKSITDVMLGPATNRIAPRGLPLL